VLMGTVEYMSPEQALCREVDYRTDIFSLGVVLYQMATGRSPFAAMSIGETIDRILHDEPESISRLNPRIPPELESVIRTCLEKERERRYQSAQELLADLSERRQWTASATTVRASLLRPKWVIAFAVFGLIAWLATLALIVEQRLERRTDESNRAPQTIAANDAKEAKPSTPVPTSAADNRVNQPDRAAPTNQPGSPEANRSSPPAPPADATDRGKEAQAKSVSGSNDANTRNRPGSTTESQPVLPVAVPNDANIPTIIDTLFSPAGIALDSKGNIYISDSDGARIYKVTPSGEILTIAGTGIPGFSGDGGPASSAQLQNPAGITMDGAGNLYVADRPYRIRKITPGGIISTVVGDGNSGIAADGRPATAAPLVNPTSVSVDSLGNMYFVESLTRIRKVTRDGVIHTVVSADPPETGAFTGVAVNKAGDVYIANPGKSRILKVTLGAAEPSVVAGTGVRGISGDGGLATSAQLSYPSQIAIDEAGTLYINDAEYRRIRKVTPDGIIRTILPESGVAGVRAGPTLANSPGLAVDANGVIYALQSGNPQSVVRMPPDGKITTAVLWRGDVEPVRVGQRGINAKQISTKASLSLDGQTSYPMGAPQVVIENVGRIDARVSFSRVGTCNFEFEVTRADASANAPLSQKGAGPTLNVSGEVEAGTYNLVLRFQRGQPKCINGPGASMVLRYLVTFTPR
jgi:sugar lactone lactonase YvrE